MSAERRPETLVEKQIREAAERGAFDNLSGAGKPLRGLDQPFTAERWARDWIQREGGDTSVLLSPLLILRKERAKLLENLADITSEQNVREVVREFNLVLLEQYRRPMNGPLIPVGVLDPDETVAHWRQQRGHQPTEEPVPPAPERPASRWRQFWNWFIRG